MNSVTVITPTGDRPLSFGLLRDRWMKNQTVKPDQWIIVDDGETPYNTENLPDYAEYIRRESCTDSGGHTIGKNLEHGLTAAKCDTILVMEDDDWYSPGYVAYMKNLLVFEKLAGLWGTNYYHVQVPGYREMGRNTHAALSVTGFKRSFIPKIIKSIPGNISIDLRIWHDNKGLLIDGRKLKMHCSIKGMPGREGAGVGHIKKHYTNDPNYEKLRLWCSDADVYIDLMEKNVV